jgi:8-oxo-dGTP diphosphatase
MITTAGVALHNGKEVFLAKRRPGRNLGTCWEFPGGKTKEGESPEEALKREYREEFGADIEIVGSRCTGEFWCSGTSYRLYAFLISFLSEPRCLEHEESRWVPFKELYGYDFPPSDSIILGALREYERSRILNDGTIWDDR